MEQAMNEWIESVETFKGWGTVRCWRWDDWLITYEDAHLRCFYDPFGCVKSFYVGTTYDGQEPSKLALAKEFCEAGEAWLADERWER